MADAWDDDDDWETAEPVVVGGGSTGTAGGDAPVSAAWEEEDITLVEREREEALKKEKAERRDVTARREREEAEAERERVRLRLEAQRAAEANMTEEEKRERARRLVEESDNQLTEELFGVSSAPSDEAKADANAEEAAGASAEAAVPAPAAAPRPAGTADIEISVRTLEAAMLSAQRLAAHVHQPNPNIPVKTRNHVNLQNFLMELIRGVKEGLTVDDLVELASYINVVKNQLVESQRGKKKKKKNKSVRVERSNTDMFDDMGMGGGADAFDEDSFM